MKPILKSITTFLRARGGADDGPVPSAVQQTILIIDDDQSFLLAAGNLLEGLGYRVFTAACGGDGVETVRHFGDEIDLVLLDYRLPDMDGAETLQSLRELVPHLKVVGISALGAIGLPEGFLEGVELLISKPFPIQELAILIPTLLNGSATLDAEVQPVTEGEQDLSATLSASSEPYSGAG